MHADFSKDGQQRNIGLTGTSWSGDQHVTRFFKCCLENNRLNLVKVSCILECLLGEQRQRSDRYKTLFADLCLLRRLDTDILPIVGFFGPLLRCTLTRAGRILVDLGRWFFDYHNVVIVQVSLVLRQVFVEVVVHWFFFQPKPLIFRN